ncbi:MAG TPA: acetoacetate--CoA ligase [Gemmatimonadales bacterium]|jgi:acetoacetyl-CoA synthetase|nr:acetoacetate--CoA ligase [Gemmatimonadales bacterium]
MTRPVWAPQPSRVAGAQLTRFLAHVRAAAPEGAAEVWDVPSLYAWSVARPDAFWPEVWRFCGVVAEERPGREPWDRVVVGLDRMAPPDPTLGPRWFEGARLNFAENLLRHDGDRDALVFWNELGRQRTLSRRELRREVAAAAGGFASLGVGPGDRVAGFLPNLPETVIAMLAAASLGAIWSSCSPDFGVNGVMDRFGQIRPRLLVCADGYRYAGKAIDLMPRVREVGQRLPEIQRMIVVPYLDARPDIAGLDDAIRWDELLAAHRGPDAPAYARLPFDHPLYIVYSSGTTGLPKCMVHGAGGTLLQHSKEHVLHTDLGAEDRVFYYTTCGWMMWNWLVSALATGATVVLYDGAPLFPPPILWDMAAEERLTVFGTSAKYLALAEKQGLVPARTHDLGRLRSLLSTGSPLAAHSFDYVYSAIKSDVHLMSVSGGTDIISCFALGNPIGPVWRGELQMRGLGMAVEVYDPEGTPTRGREGELVCTRPFPSMPVSFWDDPQRLRYRAAYFDYFPGVWRHGDWARLTEHDGLVILGRSDATLNPGGVRIGTAEIYRQVEQLPEVLESLVIGQDWDGDTRVVLFVRLREGVALDRALEERIRRRIREHASPHHVPRKILQVSDIPRTISGKITELAVRDVVHGRPVNNLDALANPAALDLYRDLEALRT